jgi:serine/threonine protein phosphatase PrpC
MTEAVSYCVTYLDGAPPETRERNSRKGPRGFRDVSSGCSPFLLPPKFVAADHFSDTNSLSLMHSENQDSILADETNLVFAVADGVGGYPGAKEASQLAVDIIGERASSLVDEERLRACVAEIHSEVKRKAKDLGYPGMGTTVALAKVTPNTGGDGGGKILSANVGDSPILLFPRVTSSKQARGYVRLYQDDSERGLDPSNLWSIVQYVGYGGDDNEELEIHSSSSAFDSGDMLLLCSDGVTDNFEGLHGRDGLAEFVRRTRNARRLVEEAIRIGFKPDDMSAILVSL